MSRWCVWRWLAWGVVFIKLEIGIGIGSGSGIDSGNGTDLAWP